MQNLMETAADFCQILRSRRRQTAGMLTPVNHERMARSDWRTRALVDAGIMLDHRHGSARAFTFMVEHGVSDEVVARVLSLDAETADQRPAGPTTPA